MKIRQATANDFPRVLELNEESVRFLSPLSHHRLSRLHEQAAQHVVIEHRGEVGAFLLAFRERAVYDSINYLWFENRYAQFLYVDRVVVGRPLQGQGAGKLLYEHLFRAAREAHVPYVTCEIDLVPPNAVSSRFHARFGFREVGRQAVDGGAKQVSLQIAGLPAANGA